MKKITLIAVTALSAALFSCKSKSGDKAADKSTDTSKSTATQSAASPTASTPNAEQTNAPKTYVVTFTPDSALLGKQKEALLKVIPVGATELNDPEGKSQGIELTFKISVTNKNKIGGNNVGITPNDFRMTLDNNNSITQTSGSYFSTDPESTKESETITYRIPAGAKPKALNLFYDETRATVQVEIK